MILLHFSPNKGKMIFSYFQAAMLLEILQNGKFQRGQRLRFDIPLKNIGGFYMSLDLSSNPAVL